MRILLTIILLTGAAMLFSSCVGPRLEAHKDMKPALSLEEYFTGPIKAWGVVQNWRGDIVSRFDVDLVGRWDGNTGVLEEHFTYYDGSTDRRTWTITRTGDNTYEGSAGDIIGKATGKGRGNAVRWNYRMELPVDGTTYRLTFDDWMWQLNDGILINRSYIKKFGITVAELTLVMQKQPPQ